MFNTASLFQFRKKQNSESADKPFGSEIFAMMAALTFALADGGPDRMSIDHGSTGTTIMGMVISPAPHAARDEVKGWYFYDPATENFRPSSFDQEQLAAQALVVVCEQALDDNLAATCCCEGKQEDEEGEEEETGGGGGGGEASLLRSSFSFAVRNEPSEPSPSVSPFSNLHGRLDIQTTTFITCADNGEDMQMESNGTSLYRSLPSTISISVGPRA